MENQIHDETIKVLCSNCTHNEVCSFKTDYLSTIDAVKKNIELSFIDDISIGCRYYEHWSESYKTISRGDNK